MPRVPYNSGAKKSKDSGDKQKILRSIPTTHETRLWKPQFDLGWQSDYSCVGHAWASFLACRPTRIKVDPEGLYLIAKQNDGWKGTNYKGTTIEAGAKVLQMLGILEEYRWGNKLKAICSHLLEVGPIVAAINWYEQMDDVGDNGIMAIEGKFMEYHAVLVCGCDTKRKRLTIKNSWGSLWGKGGYGYLSFKDTEKMIEDGCEFCAGILQTK